MFPMFVCLGCMFSPFFWVLGCLQSGLPQVFKAEGSLGQSMMFQPTAVTAARAREVPMGDGKDGLVKFQGQGV